MALAELGVCYYPEHWPLTDWPRQARLMAEAGISRVRIGEFAWSRIEPARDCFDWQWLDEALNRLAEAGLGVIMCTPTACPPQWLVEELPEILPVDEQGRIRGFGSRRHYRFASKSYRREALRISRKVIERYGSHPSVVGWQLDNEYGCHETTLSYSDDDERAFQDWLRDEYGHIAALNRAWGTVFWSQEYADFSKVPRPNLTVTEANPAHRFAYWRFASDQVVSFNRDQATLLKGAANGESAPWITHNFMGNFSDFDHFAVAKDLDVATWDSYPLGFLDQGWAPDDEKLRYRRIGHPDWAAFHHDLYRAVGRGRFGVMEQQPGPVNWAPANADPLPGAPAFWAMEAVAHGAELVSFFRFQQIPRAQEQMHAALRLPNGDPAPAWASALQVADALQTLPADVTDRGSVALLFDYASCWATTIQPHGPAMGSLRQAMDCYSAIRSLGLDVDILGPDDDPGPYAVLVIPGSVFVTPELVSRISDAKTRCLVMARSGSRDADFAIPDGLAPGPIQTLLPLRVTAVDSMRVGAHRSFNVAEKHYRIEHWFESLDTELEPRVRCTDGAGFWYEHQGHHYLNGLPGTDFISLVLREMLSTAGLSCEPLAEGLRLRRRGTLTFAFNFSPDERAYDPDDATLLLGEKVLRQGEWAVWQATGT